MALVSNQIALTAEIVRETYASVVSATSSLNAAQQTLLIDDLDLWEAVRNSFVKLKGGGDGVDFDNQRKRAAIFYRVRQLLGYPFVVYSLDAEMMELIELEVGQNFS
jgi:hypothetical protein